MMPSSSVPSLSLDGWVPELIKENVDKFVHLLFYLMLSFALGHDLWVQRTDFTSKKMIIWAIIVPILYGGLIEIMQATLTTTRSGDVVDLLFDATGTICGYFLAKKFVPRWFAREAYGNSKC